MNKVKLFKEFINSKQNWYFGKGTNTRIKQIIKDLENEHPHEDAYEIIEDKIISRHSITGKKIMLSYYKYIKEKYNIEYGTKLNASIEIRNDTERILELIKLVHEKKTREELMEELGVRGSQFSEDLSTLRNGFTLLGNKVKLDLKNRNDNGIRCYKSASTCHPIFLPLNLTEVYALTVYLPKLLKSSSNMNGLSEELINNIISRIRSQLSDYAIEIISKDSDEEDYHFNSSMSFITEKDQISNSREWLIFHLMKSQKQCKFIFPNEKIYIGTLYNENTLRTNENKEIKIKNIDEIEILPL